MAKHTDSIRGESMSGWLDPFDFKHTAKVSTSSVFQLFKLSNYLGKEIEKVVWFIARILWRIIVAIVKIIVAFIWENNGIRHINKRLLPRAWQKYFFLSSFSRHIPYPVRKKHTYILGNTGSGKSELLKLFLYNDIHSNCGVLVIDPHGDLVQECKKFKLFEKPEYMDKLVYISPEYRRDGYFPHFNPLEHDFHKLPTLDDRQTAIGIKAEELAGAFETLFRGEWTPHMSRLIKYSLWLLMEDGNASLLDLLEVINPDISDRFTAKADKHPDKWVRNYFATSFIKQDGIRSTKAGVLGRLDEAFSNPQLRKMVEKNQSTFRLTELLNQGKVVLINASQSLLGQKGTNIFGAVLLSELTTYALSRAETYRDERTSIFIYIDECQNFLTDNIGKILSEARKYNIHLTLANQTLGHFSGEGLTRLKKEVLANTNVKVFGGGDSGAEDDRNTMSKEMGMELKEVKNLMAGKFAVKSGAKKGVTITFQDFLVLKKGRDNRYYMSDKAWEVWKKDQWRKYYEDRYTPQTPAPPTVKKTGEHSTNNNDLSSKLHSI